MTRAVVLFSGGLDSLLATKILQEQNIEVIGLNLVTPFHDCSECASVRADELGIELVVTHFGDEYMTILSHPRWGIGKGVNPCIDCRIEMLRVAKRLMEDRQLDFVATGEISGQRPNSQMMHQLSLITRESGLGGKLVRPLSAKVLPPTDPEKEGLLRRERLLSCTGRGRTGLIARAKDRYGISEIPQPSTGCLLCEKSFAPRVRDLLRHKTAPTIWDAELLAMGRHLRIDAGTKGVVSRTEAEGKRLGELFARADRSRSVLMVPYQFNGPSVLLVGDFAPELQAKVLPHDDETTQRLAVGGGLVLRFDAPEKYSHRTPPSVLLHWGDQRVEEYVVAKNPTAEALPIIGQTPFDPRPTLGTTEQH